MVKIGSEATGGGVGITGGIVWVDVVDITSGFR